jgi:hypothetical protein
MEWCSALLEHRQRLIEVSRDGYASDEPTGFLVLDQG